jgi:hypothetical protein
MPLLGHSASFRRSGPTLRSGAWQSVAICMAGQCIVLDGVGWGE